MPQAPPARPAGLLSLSPCISMSFTVRLKPFLSLAEPPKQTTDEKKSETTIWRALKYSPPHKRENYEYTVIPTEDLTVNIRILGHGTISVSISPINTAKQILEKINSQCSIRTGTTDRSSDHHILIIFDR